MLNIKVSAFEHEIEDPIAKGAMAIILIALLVVTSPVLYLIHHILVASGRRGFFNEKENGDVSILVDQHAFERVTG